MYDERFIFNASRVASNLASSVLQFESKWDAKKPYCNTHRRFNATLKRWTIPLLEGLINGFCTTAVYSPPLKNYQKVIWPPWASLDLPLSQTNDDGRKNTLGYFTVTCSKKRTQIENKNFHVACYFFCLFFLSI